MFKNEPFTDFTIPSNRSNFEEALRALQARIEKEQLWAAPIVNGKEIESPEISLRVDPSDPSVVVSRTKFASLQDVDNALEYASNCADSWAKVPATDRSNIIKRAAQEMRSRRLELVAIIIREAGKSWREADADVAEAIDFCDYYAEEILRIAPPILTMEVAGEDNHYFYQPRGVALIIAPWNFPLAIACGMAVAALVTGNPVILKPAEQTSYIAYELAKILLKAGIPPGAFSFLPGYGEQIGRKLVASPKVSLICFTGSRPVGLEILKASAVVAPDQYHMKKVILELGGKNAIIVDEDADLDEAVKGVIASAFGFSGQKCSACSRVLVVGRAKDQFLPRLMEAAKDLIVGKSSEPATLLGPVIDEESQKRILNVIADSERSFKPLFKGTVPKNGYFVPATIFQDVAAESSLWREEVFGPVVAVRCVPSFEHAIKEANDCQYALTGGVFSRSPAHLEQAKSDFKVGNLYLNRSCTGALVCRQPFGGFKLSGIGSKAGGKDYLLQFLEPRTVTENTMRRGFTPESK